jgi:hypothetical protein
MPYITVQFSREGVLLFADLPHDIVPLGEKCQPLIQCGLLLVPEVLPVRMAIFWLSGRHSKSTGSVFASENYE